VVSVLLENNASVHGKNGKGNSPLMDAIKYGHDQLVELLLVHGADLLTDTRGKDGASIDACDMLFARKNPLVIAAAAAGLKKVSAEQLDKLTCTQFVRFLREKGNTPINIVNAVMREHPIRYWEGNDRVFVKAGYVDESYGYNVEVGPHPEFLTDAWTRKSSLPTDSKAAFDLLIPQLDDPTSHMEDPVYQAVNAWCCHVPFVQRDIDVLRALTETPVETLFDEPACQAIVQLHWQQVRKSSFILMGLEVVYLCLLCMLNIALNESRDDSKWRMHLRVFAWLTLLMWAILFSVDLIHIVGNIATGNKRIMLLSLQRKLFHHSVRLFAGVMLLVVVIQFGMDQGDTDTKRYPFINVSLGTLIVTRWVSTLWSLRAIKPIGVRVLPILRTMRGIGPFVGVLATQLVGVIFGYYALGLKSFRESLTIVWGVVFFGVAENEVTGADSPGYFWIVQFFVVSLSFFVGLSMLNMLIAVLSAEYQIAADTAFRSFMHVRACMSIDHFLVLEGFRSIRHCKRRSLRQMTQEHSSQQRTSKISEWGAERVHVWYCMAQGVR
jgi:hypothetical protein